MVIQCLFIFPNPKSHFHSTMVNHLSETPFALLYQNSPMSKKQRKQEATTGEDMEAAHREHEVWEAFREEHYESTIFDSL